MKTYLALWIILSTSLTSFAQMVPSQWLEGERGFKKAIEIQKAKNYPILVWTTWSDCPNCSNVTKYLNTFKVRNALKDYIRVSIDEHGKPADAEFAKNNDFSGGYFYILSPSSATPVDRIWAWQDSSQNKVILPDLEVNLAQKLAAAKP